ncbi:XRE family transcriptional regulator [Pantoea sp. Seng]|jgi:predicted XRE-type DNA-binding protein|uniref:helix-turn-helix domain-containing protein n=1 Tax=Pantoea sp. Seng TaxID=2576761 RepID=UPI00132B4368|nr:XRE family transcriptional regulator [Pantoea sp. Seng]MXP56057.1 XRE family transcriptional regulator [Pantoea sp. Seng]
MDNNVFSILTSDPVQLETWTLKSNLIMKIHQHVRRNEWSQAQAAKAIGITQPRVSNMLKGRLDLFSIDFLMTALFKLGYRVDMAMPTQESSDRSTDLSMEIKG